MFQMLEEVRHLFVVVVVSYFWEDLTNARVQCATHMLCAIREAWVRARQRHQLLPHSFFSATIKLLCSFSFGRAVFTIGFF